MQPTTSSLLRSLVALAFLLAAPAIAQCTPQWLPGDGLPGVGNNGATVLASTMWDPDGPGPLQRRLVVAGTFRYVGNVPANNIAAFDPATGTWSALGSGLEGSVAIAGAGVSSLAVMANGDLVVGGFFTTAGGVAANSIARWNGSTWSTLGTGFLGASGLGSVAALAVLPSGDLVAGGFFTTAGGVVANNVARWDGSVWSTLGGGFVGTSALLQALAVLPNGELVVGGNFFLAGGQVSARFARYAPTCPAAAAPAGSACPGAGGSNAYSPTNLPWIGSTYRARSTTIPPSAFVVVATGLASMNVPLASLLPLTPPGCSLLVTPDVLEWTASNAGTVDTQLPIPDTLVLVGLQLHQQLLLLEVDQNLQFLANTSSNAITLTIGAL
jgi:hypothetical protein